MTEVNTVAVQKPRRWPLYASLFLNVVLITVLAVGAWRIHQARESFGDIGPWMPRQIERIVPVETAAKVKAIREAHTEQFRTLFEAARTARGHVRKALETEPFDSAALKAALAGMREADSAVAVATADVVVEIAETLSPAERLLVREKARDFRKRGGREDRSGAHKDRGDKPSPNADGPPPPPEGDMPPPPPPEGP